ncbi:hypothetical protein LP420_14150 [Massilia sp. B-10]|nr:hypothetical protein LP420_14150 [Massilia sp. B-10]
MRNQRSMAGVAARIFFEIEQGASEGGDEVGNHGGTSFRLLDNCEQHKSGQNRHFKALAAAQNAKGAPQGA